MKKKATYIYHATIVGNRTFECLVLANEAQERANEGTLASGCYSYFPMAPVSPESSTKQSEIPVSSRPEIGVTFLSSESCYYSNMLTAYTLLCRLLSVVPDTCYAEPLACFHQQCAFNPQDRIPCGKKKGYPLS